MQARLKQFISISVEGHIYAMNGDESAKVDDFFIWEATPTLHEISKKLELTLVEFCICS